MNITLERFRSPVALARLEVALGNEPPPTETLDATVDLGGCVEVVELVRSAATARSDRRTGDSEWDAELCGPLHAALSPVLTRRHATDARFWHWLTTRTFLREFVWLRWHGLVPADVSEALADGNVGKRFIGSNSLNGFSRNALARLYWTVETLREADSSEAEAVELARAALTMTDLHVGVFERRLGLHRTTAAAAIRLLRGHPEQVRRDALLHVNRIATTTAIEALDREQIEQLITEGVERAS